MASQKESAYRCPSCGSYLICNFDAAGRSYQCHEISCMQAFEAEQVEPATKDDLTAQGIAKSTRQELEADVARLLEAKKTLEGTIKSLLQSSQQVVDTLLAEIELLKEALKPFAEAEEAVAVINRARGVNDKMRPHEGVRGDAFSAAKQAYRKGLTPDLHDTVNRLAARMGGVWVPRGEVNVEVRSPTPAAYTRVASLVQWCEDKGFELFSR